MATNQPNPRHVEILAEVKQRPIELHHVVTCRQALTAIARAVEEETATLRSEVERLRGEYMIQRLTHQLFCGKVAEQLGFEETGSLFKESKDEITCGLEGGGDKPYNG